MAKRRDVFSFFANPFVVLADIMVCLVFIVALFLLSTSVYSEEIERLAQIQVKRERFAYSLSGQLKSRQFQAERVDIAAEKYRIGDILEVESDGTLQRFRFLGKRMDFKRNSVTMQSPETGSRLLAVLGATLLQNRSSIKSIVIEGHAAPDESDPWLLSQRRAEVVRSAWDKSGLLGTILWSTPLRSVDYLRRVHLWDEKRFHEWHREEYQARRVQANGGLGVIPEAWVISSGRGDQVRREPVVEFKIEYTERDAPSIDEVMRDSLSPAQLVEAKQLGIYKEVPKK